MSMSNTSNQKVTIPKLFVKKKNREKIVTLTAYDFPSARLMDQAGIDIVLVGDSLGMVVLGYRNTIPVTMDEMLHHTKAVCRGVERALVIADMPYFSFHMSEQDSLFNASRFIKEAGAQAVKIEGASASRLRLIEVLVDAEIPVMGHVGLTPQSICKFGEFKVRGKNVEEAQKIISDAVNLEKAGVFSVVLECIPEELAQVITEKLEIPTIGIGAGIHCDGQVLVFHDLVGFSNGYLPKFVKRYMDLSGILSEAVKEYIQDVKDGKFPGKSHSYHLGTEARNLLKKRKSKDVM